MVYFYVVAFATLILSANNVGATPFHSSPVQSKRNVQTTHVARLLSKAHPTQRSQLKRRLDEEEEEEQIDLSGYLIKFVKCQFVKSYNDELAEDEDAETV